MPTTPSPTVGGAVGDAAAAEALSDRAKMPASSAPPTDLMSDMCDLRVVLATVAEWVDDRRNRYQSTGQST